MRWSEAVGGTACGMQLLGSAPGSTCVPTGTAGDGLHQMPSFLALGSRESCSWTLVYEAEVDAALHGALDVLFLCSCTGKLGTHCCELQENNRNFTKLIGSMVMSHL